MSVLSNAMKITKRKKEKRKEKCPPPLS
jgi:hypothetical protein